MSQKIQCPICDATFEADDQATACKCPECGMEVLIEQKKPEKPKTTKKPSSSKSTTSSKNTSSATKKIAASKERAAESKKSKVVFGEEYSEENTKEWIEVLKKAQVQQNVGDFDGLIETATKLTEIRPNAYEGWSLLATAHSSIIVSKITQNKFNDDALLEQVDTYFDKAYSLCRDRRRISIRKTHAQFLKLNLVHAKEYGIQMSEANIKKLQDANSPKQKTKPAKVKYGGSFKDIKVDKSSVLEDPEPIKFPSDNKIIRIIFWILFGFTALYAFAAFTMLFNPDLFGKDLLAKASLMEKVSLVAMAVMFIILMLSWITYYFIRRFKKVDSSMPKTIKYARIVLVCAFLIILTIFVYYEIMNLVYTNMSGLIGTIEKYEAYGIYVKNCGIALAVSFSAVVLLEIINKFRLNAYLNDGMTVFDFLYLVLGLAMLLSIVTVALFGIAALLNFVPNLFNLVFGASATVAVAVIHKVLIISSIVFGAAFVFTLIVGFIQSALEKSATAKQAKKLEAEEKARKEKAKAKAKENGGAFNFDDAILAMNKQERETAIANLKTLIKFSQDEIEEIKAITNDEEIISRAKAKMKKNKREEIVIKI